jgi:hypothetical protein
MLAGEAGQQFLKKCQHTYFREKEEEEEEEETATTTTTTIKQPSSSISKLTFYFLLGLRQFFTA